MKKNCKQLFLDFFRSCSSRSCGRSRSCRSCFNSRCRRSHGCWCRCRSFFFFATSSESSGSDNSDQNERFIHLKYLIKKIPECASWKTIKPSPHSKYWVSSGTNYSEKLLVFTLDCKLIVCLQQYIATNQIWLYSSTWSHPFTHHAVTNGRACALKLQTSRADKARSLASTRMNAASRPEALKLSPLIKT